MEQQIISAVGSAVNSVVKFGAWKATKYLSRTLVVRATQQLYAKKLPAKNAKKTITLTIGKPNYAERDFLKDCVEAGVKFPIQAPVLKFPPQKKLSKSEQRRIKIMKNKK